MSTQETALAGVIGHPVSHSLSPEIFGFLSRATGRPLAYRRVDVPAADLSAAFEGARALGVFTGFNVTIPYKESIAGLVDRLTPEARAVGAVNVVHFDGRHAVGHNTDVIGVRETFREQGVRLKGRDALVFGAGGAAAAAVYAIAQAGADRIVIVNRSLPRAQLLARRMRKLFARTHFEPAELGSSSATRLALRDGFAAYVNATPVGMQGFASRRMLPPIVAERALAFDLVYRPEVTPFMRAAEKLGLPTVNGLDMLIWQALATWEIWFGRLPSGSRDRTKRDLKKHLERVLRS